MKQLEPLFTRQEAATYLKVSQRTVDRLILDLGLRVFKVGRCIRIPASSVRQMLVDGGMTTTEREELVQDLYME